MHRPQQVVGSGISHPNMHASLQDVRLLKVLHDCLQPTGLFRMVAVLNFPMQEHPLIVDIARGAIALHGGQPHHESVVWLFHAGSRLGRGRGRTKINVWKPHMLMDPNHHIA